MSTDHAASASAGNSTARRGFLKAVGGGALATSIAGCLGNTGLTGGSDEVSMTLASTFSESHVLVAGAAQRFKEIVEEETDGQFTVDIAPGGSYGAEDEISELVTEGGVEGHSQGTFPFIQFAPRYFFISCPFVMEDFDHILQVHDSELMEEAYEQVINDGNQRPVGNMVYRGARQLGTKEDTGGVTTPDDVQGVTLRVGELPSWIQIFSEIGFDTAAIAWPEVYSALQTGTADAVEAPPGAIDSAQLYEVFDVLSLTSHQITTGNIFLNEEFFQSLSDTYQEVVLMAGEEATNHATDLAEEQEQEFIDAFESEHDVTINADVDRGAFRSAAEPAIQNLFDEEWAHTWDEVRNV